MEILDLYDKNFNKVNKTIIRRVDEIPKGNYVMASYLLIKNNNKYLLESGAGSHENTFGIPGGHVSTGETGEEGMVREVYEEINFKVNNYKLLDKFIYPYNSYIFNVYYTEDEVDINILNYQPTEVMEVVWLTKDEILQYIHEGRIKKGYAYILENYMN